MQLFLFSVYSFFLMSVGVGGKRPDTDQSGQNNKKVPRRGLVADEMDDPQPSSSTSAARGAEAFLHRIATQPVSRFLISGIR